ADDEPIDATECPRVTARPHAPIACGVLDARAACAERFTEERPALVAAHAEHALAGHVLELGHRQQALAVRAARRRDDFAGARLLELAARAGADRGGEPWRPRRRGSQGDAHRGGADEHDEVVFAEAPER